MKFHNLNIHKPESQGCNNCGFKSTRKNSLESHDIEKHGSESHNCYDCDSESTRKKFLKHPEEKHEPETYNGLPGLE